MEPKRCTADCKWALIHVLKRGTLKRRLTCMMSILSSAVLGIRRREACYVLERNVSTPIARLPITTTQAHSLELVLIP